MANTAGLLPCLSNSKHDGGSMGDGFLDLISRDPETTCVQQYNTSGGRGSGSCDY